VTHPFHPLCGQDFEFGWLVIDLDGTLITARSDKEGAAPTFKLGYGFHPLGAWCANTAESLWGPRTRPSVLTWVSMQLARTR
jgi:hypothetical protein